MGLSFRKGEEPEQYFCERCKPENHKVLLEKIASGEKPWEVAAEQRQRLAKEKKPGRRKKGKRGSARGRSSETKSEGKKETPSVADASSPPSTTEKNGAAPKRKFEEQEESAVEEKVMFALTVRMEQAADSHKKAPEMKQRKTSPHPKLEPPAKADSALATEKPVVPAAKTPEEIKNQARESAARALIKLFVEQVNEALKQKSFTLADGQKAEDAATRLGLAIEQAMYQNICAGTGEPTEPYKVQLRTILFNVKKNHSLRDGLLVGSVSPSDLSKMTAQDMASEELQQRDAEIKREAERQHIIVKDQGPRIRRTHKGEELVEDDSHVTTDPVFSAAPAVRDSSRVEGNPAGQIQLSPTAATATQSRPGFLAAKPGPANNNAGTLVGNGFQSGIRSPDTSNQDNLFPEVAANIKEPIPRGKVQADAEIDHLLRDEFEPDSPPYSPKDFDEDAVWRGKVVMKSIAEFSSSGKHVGGADFSTKIPWSELMPETLLVDGRIDIQLASDYLCGLRFSNSTGITVVAVKRPAAASEQAGFDELFKYFTNRKRYGVVGSHPVPYVKDTYVVPVESGQVKKPEFIELLDNSALEEMLPEPVLLVVLVVKISDSSPSAVQPMSYRAQEPAGGPMAVPRGTPHALPSANSPLSPSFGQSQPQQGHPQPQQTLALALQIIGPQANLPVVQQVIRQMPSVNASQMAVVRDVLQQHPNAASSYETLMSALYRATNNH